MPQGRAAPRRLVKGAKAKNKSTKGAGAARRAVRRDLPALKLLAESSGQLTIGWSQSGGDPHEWSVHHKDGDKISSQKVCEIGQVGARASGSCQIRSVPLSR